MSAAPVLARAGVAVIDRHMDRLAAVLGPRDRAAEDLLDELRDGVLASAERRSAAGVPAIAAARAALAELGDVADLLPALTADLLAARAHACARVMLRTGPVAATIWVGALVIGPATLWSAAGWPAVPPLVGAGVLTTAACALVAVGAARGAGAARARLAHRSALAATIAGSLTDLGAVCVAASWLAAGGHARAWPAATAAALVAVLFSSGRIVLLGRRARHLWMARPA